MALGCVRCDRTYRSHKAFYQHIRDSPRHWECPECDFDGECWSELLDHCREEGCRTVCQGCNNGGGMHWECDSQEYYEHLEEDNVCTTCERHFSSPSNLHQHRLSHRTARIKCLRCTQTFKTYGGMIIHLEYGSCDNIDLIDLNMAAAECRVCHQFIDSLYLEDMRDGYDLNARYLNKPYPYQCPSCNTQLPKLSSLFQHVESSACDQTLDEGAIGRLRRFLKKRFG